MGEEHGDSLDQTVNQEPNAQPKKFSAETRSQLERAGYVIISSPTPVFNAYSIDLFGPDGRFPTYSSWHRTKEEPFLDESCRAVEYAIHPNQLFLPGSNNKTIEEQQQMIAELSASPSFGIAGAQAVMGNAIEYALVADIFHARSRIPFFQEGQYARTTSVAADGEGVLVGKHFETKQWQLNANPDNLQLAKRASNKGGSQTYAFPLVIPKAA